ncbi:MAG: sulfite exporter TauE/SafE family protein [Sphingobacteriales bacterium]|jgi:sulfite exporter TauE/SafE|nr:sulfite exporter TauE/SafE family protein [Sphingobacteriales bacterium]MBP9140177.1 sulfite exporter TauE/SafE family protein [Chitinophagales bacterium]MDA0197689.1 sulfite exporter TauE/SafE family protein [Bacteroidota bacterium]MBK6888952.1 sulfite exporter TauE/SafE family protein [Sphingobacteriales bacterium]MBK7528546.1 sulfite exporter TauE/SafE family protein [Sphingobacteriales bacterium]
MLSAIGSALLLGFMGSFHCLGMCGPLVINLPLPASNSQRILAVLVYHSGRTLAYALMGAAVGLLGHQIAIAGYQQILSVVIGVLLLATLIATRFKYALHMPKFFDGISAKIVANMSHLLATKRWQTLPILGFLNGLLPCGLVYIGIAGAIVAGSALNGALFMAAFGFGTMPALISLSLIGSSLKSNFKAKLRSFMPVALGLMAIILIFRGLNLGIPYLSPKITENGQVIAKPKCH